MLRGIVSYEYRMAIRRWGVWLAFALGALLPILNALMSPGPPPGGRSVWQTAGMGAFVMSLWMPLVAGIALADRLPRERTLLTWELLETTGAPRRQRILGKCLGGLLAVCTPVLAFELMVAGIHVARGATPALFATTALAFAAVNFPALAFVSAFSIACPVVLPVRVYQVLFCGYWFWGNFLNPKAFPTIAGTVLTASGQFAASLWFGFGGGGRQATLSYVVLNLCVLAGSSIAALAAAVRYLEWRSRRA